MVEPLVSVIVPVYNHENYIGECMESIICQTYKNIELIVLNDGSMDKSHEKIESWREKCEERFKRFVYIYKQNQGICKTINLGISMAEGKYIIPFGGDDIMLPLRVQYNVEAMEEDEQIGMVFSNGYEFESHLNIFKPFYKKRQNIKDGWIFKELLKHYYLSATTFCIRRDVYDEVEIYNESYHIEDYDMSLKIAKQYKIKYIPYHLVKYRVVKESFSRNRNTKLKMLLDHKRIMDSYINTVEAEVAQEAQRDYDKMMLDYYFEIGDRENFKQYFMKYKQKKNISFIAAVKNIWIHLGIPIPYYFKWKSLIEYIMYHKKKK